jgi:hypothetical protein
MWFKQGEDKGKCGFWLKACFEPNFTNAAMCTNVGYLDRRFSCSKKLNRIFGTR